MELPQTIGRYRVEGLIATGGFATVYRAHDDRLDSTVAIKVLAENHAFDPDVRERFLQEGRVLRQLAGPHLVTVHDLGESDRGQPYLVLDHADRGTLADRVTERRAASWTPTADDVLHLVGTLADALAAVHAARVVHRDLAPRNLLLRSTGTPDPTPGPSASGPLIGSTEQLLLADLGLSKDLATASGLTVAGGTTGFTPPEQRHGPSTVDHRADLWSATALVVWLVSGDPPDADGGWRRLIAEGWTPAFAEALERGLAPRPIDRPDDAEAWHRAIATTLDAAPPAPGQLADRPDRPDRRLRTRLLAGLGAAIGAAAAVVGLALVPDRGGDPETTRTELADGRARTEATDGDHRVAIIGPAEAPLDEPVLLLAESEGIEHLTWVGPDGTAHPGVDSLSITATTPGRATVHLVGAHTSGATTASFEIRFVDP